ncbi:MLO-like protein 12 isoform X2 [Magnolia sinica]|uniref:MLO-like protein 12 isoform X2 n=1 Tax=Magnolia sinica TaxID=86752 RepID=UPI0026591C5E|nr:MLO-like protein 12 isoform X2 [Magnolia sinica]
MAGESTANEPITLKETPTWAVAVVCAVLIIISILIEHALHLLTMFFRRRNRKSLNQALYKIKAELMVFGFISLSLTIGEQPISKICVPKSVGDHFLPCKNTTLPSDVEEESTCQKKDKISLLSTTGVSELHMLIFGLALFHILSCVLTLCLGMAKMKRWESWEEETTTVDYQFSNDPRRFKLARQTSFGRRHLHCWSKRPLLLWPASFLRLFTGSVSKADYFALRHGFITAHLSEGSKFDFQKFLRRALDSDFEVVVGISPWIWIFTVLFIFFNAHGFYSYLWLPFIPLMMVLAVGTKLQFIITKMCLESQDASVVVRGTVLVKPNDNLFWFGRPHLLLHLIHLILFQNSFQLAFFTWTWMGSSMKKVVFSEQITKGLKNWHSLAKRSITPNRSSSTCPSPEPSPSHKARTSLSKTQELVMTEHIQHSTPSPNVVSVSVEITEEAVTEPNTNTKGNYNGEISFAWRS